MFLFDVTFLLTANEDPTSDITDEILAAGLDTYLTTTVIDQLALAIPVFSQFMDSPHNVSQNGGHRVRIPLRTKKTDGAVSFGKNSTITPQRKPVLSYAWATFKQILSYVRFNAIEERENAGSGKVVDIVTERMAATLQDAKEDIQTMLWGDGTDNGAKDFMGITGLIPADPRTGTIMGYDRSLDINAWWRNWYWDGVTAGPHPIDAEAAGGAPVNVGAFGTYAGAAGTGTLAGAAVAFKIFDTGYNSVMAGESPSDMFWLSDQAVYQYYETDYPLHTHNIEIPINDKISVGFGGAVYKNITWIWDTIANGAPAGQLRLVNKKYVYMIKDSGMWFMWTDWRTPFNQLDRAKFLLIRGNMVQSHPRRTAVFQGITAWTATT